MDTKTCNTCGDTLKLKQFYPSKNGKLGRKPHCKLCQGHDIWYHVPYSKSCASCGLVKHLSEFYREKNSRFGRPSCIECHNEKRKQRYLKNPVSEKRKSDAWRKRNPEKVKKYVENYRKSSRGKTVKLVLQRKRETEKMNRTPKWLTEEQHRQIESFYIKARELTENTGIPHEVDHIVPLQAKDASGLHVPWNLQVLTAKENRVKKNKFSEAKVTV